MPEVPMCLYCEVPIDEEAEDFVIPNKGNARDANEWLYAHVECQEKQKRK
jgi:hypothetical protein